MALPIKETPILTGKAAKEFRRQIEKTKPLSREEYFRAKKTYEACKKAWGKAWF